MSRRRPSPAVRLVDAGAGLAERVRPGGGRLDADALEAAAVRRTGLSDFGAPAYREGLEALVSSVNGDADANAYGRLIMRRAIGIYLENRLYLTRTLHDAPERFATPLRAPLVVVGMFRTGTTALHRLLAADPAHAGVPFWRLLRPFPQREGEPPERRRRLAERELTYRRLLDPASDRVHYLRADTPEECMTMLALTFSSPFFWFVAPVYGYLDWYQRSDRHEKYREYRSLLHALQASRPDRRLVLKSPSHTDALDELLAAVPEAMVVQTHRDPVATCLSAASLTCTNQTLGTRSLDVARTAAATVDLLESMAQRSLRFREQRPERVLDVRFADLVADPVGVAEGVYRHFGLAFDEAVARDLRAHAGRNPPGRHGRHRYRAEDVGLDPAGLARRFGEYRERFLAGAGA